MTKKSNGRKLARNSKGKNNGKGHTPKRLVNIGQIVPDRILVKMPYGEMIQRSPGAATDAYQFNLNSTFDPDLTGTGHQPLGRDQFLGNMYNRYRVHSVDFTVDFSSIGTSGVSILHYLNFQNGNTIFSAITDALEQPFTVTRFQRDPSNGFLCQLKMRANLWDLWGKSREQYLSDDTTAAASGASPAEVFVGTIGLGTSDRTTSISTWQFAVRINYQVELFDRLLIAAS